MHIYKIIIEFIIAVCHYALPYKISIKRIHNHLKFYCRGNSKGCVLKNV